MIRPLHLIVFALAALAGASAPAGAQGIRVELSSNQAQPGESLTAFVTISNPKQATAPAPPKTDDFEIQMVNQPPAQKQSPRIDNGVTTRELTYTYRFFVRPLKKGLLVLPPFTFRDGGRQYASQSIRVLVGQEGAEGPQVICEVKSPRKTVFVGEPVPLTLEIWIRVFSQNGIGSLAADVMWHNLRDKKATQWGVFERAPIDQPSYRPAVRADPSGLEDDYYVYSLETTVYPSAPGPLDVGDVRFVYKYPIRLASTMFGYSLDRSRTIVARPRNVPITVGPLPEEGRPADFNGAVGQFSIRARAKPTRVAVGDPITLTLSIKGEGPLDRLLAPALNRSAELKKDFEVSGDLPAGQVIGDTKEFALTLRPLRVDVTQIPAIPFHFFDPVEKRYDAAFTSPIDIAVSPAQRLALPPTGETGTIVAPLQQEPLLENAAGLQANYVRADRVLSDQSPAGIRTLASVLMGMPALYLLVGLWQARSARYRDNVALRRRAGAWRTAKKQLDEIGPSPRAGRLRSIVLGYLSDSLNVPAGSLTREEAMRRLQDRGMPPELNHQLSDLLGLLDQAEYGGSGTIDAVEVGRAAAILSALERAVFK